MEERLRARFSLVDRGADTGHWSPTRVGGGGAGAAGGDDNAAYVRGVQSTVFVIIRVRVGSETLVGAVLAIRQLMRYDCVQCWPV